MQLKIIREIDVDLYVYDSVEMSEIYPISKIFREINLQYTLWKLRKFTLTLFWQKFRQSNVFTKESTK